MVDLLDIYNIVCIPWEILHSKYSQVHIYLSWNSLLYLRVVVRILITPGVTISRIHFDRANCMNTGHASDQQHPLPLSLLFHYYCDEILTSLFPSLWFVHISFIRYRKKFKNWKMHLKSVVGPFFFIFF